jgi:hypothetical protein
LIEPSVAGPLSALTLPSGEPESLPPPESTVNVASLVMTIVSSVASATTPESLGVGTNPEPPHASRGSTHSTTRLTSCQKRTRAAIAELRRYGDWITGAVGPPPPAAPTAPGLPLFPVPSALVPPTPGEPTMPGVPRAPAVR